MGTARALAAIFIFAFSMAADATEIRVRLQSVKAGPISVAGIAMRFPGAPSTSGFQSLKISWQSLKGRTQWTISDRDSEKLVAKFEAKTLEIAGMSLRVGLMSMPERLSFTPRAAGALDVIARLDLEKYVRGVLPSEMPASWPLEALKAQAIAARTFVLFRKKAREKIKATYDVEADVMDQVYRNPLAEEMPTKISEKVDRAIRETRGVVLLKSGDHPFATYFHADCGGRTEEPSSVWGPGESAGTAIDGACPMNPKAQWNVKYKPEEIATRFNTAANPKAKLIAIAVAERTHSGRIARLMFTWADGSSTQVSGHEFRMTLGHDKVRSTNFKIEKDGNGQFQLVGQGFGHGVGMCQWGARHLAEGGKSHRAILAHYFPKASLSTGAVAVY